MKNLIIVSLALSLLSGCGIAGLPKSGPAVVAIGTQAEYAGDSAAQTKVGKACTQNILGIVATGDSSVEAAKKNGGITSVSTMDREIFGLNIYIPLYAKSCTVIRGS
jgi:hypothetical protein